MVVWPQNLKFCLFYIVNLASTANIFFWGMEFQHSVNIQWFTPQGRPHTTFQIPRTPYPTKSYSNLKVQNLNFLLQNTVEPGFSKLFEKHKKFTIARCLLSKGFDQMNNKILNDKPIYYSRIFLLIWYTNKFCTWLCESFHDLSNLLFERIFSSQTWHWNGFSPWEFMICLLMSVLTYVNLSMICEIFCL